MVGIHDWKHGVEQDDFGKIGREFSLFFLRFFPEEIMAVPIGRGFDVLENGFQLIYFSSVDDLENKF